MISLMPYLYIVSYLFPDAKDKSVFFSSAIFNAVNSGLQFIVIFNNLNLSSKAPVVVTLFNKKDCTTDI